MDGTIGCTQLRAFSFTHIQTYSHAHQGGSKLSRSSVTHNMLSPTGKFCIRLGAGSSLQAVGQHTQRALLALVLEQYPLPDEQTHTMAAALEGPRELRQQQAARCSGRKGSENTGQPLKLHTASATSSVP